MSVKAAMVGSKEGMGSSAEGPAEKSKAAAAMLEVAAGVGNSGWWCWGWCW